MTWKSSPVPKVDPSESKTAEPLARSKGTVTPPAPAVVPDGKTAVTRTVRAATAASFTAVTADPSDGSVTDSLTPVSTMLTSSPVTATARPPTAAAPETPAFSAPSESSSGGAVSRKSPVPLNCPPGMVTVKAPPSISVVKSPLAPMAAPSAPEPPATLTVTSVSAVRAEEAAVAKEAVTDIRLAEGRSTTVSGLTDRTISSSSSSMVR